MKKSAFFAGYLFQFAVVQIDASAGKAFVDDDALKWDGMQLHATLGAMHPVKGAKTITLVLGKLAAGLFRKLLFLFGFNSGKIFFLGVGWFGGCHGSKNIIRRKAIQALCLPTAMFSTRNRKIRMVAEKTVDSLFLTFAVVFGLVIGSFLNVCIYRLPQGLSVVVPRSHCPQCGRFIHWYENIPVLSYLMLGGRCHHCRKHISLRYPLVEGLTGLLSFLAMWKFGLGPAYGLYFLCLIAPLIVVAFIDLDHRMIPDFISLPGIAAGMLTTLLVNDLPLTAALLRSLWGILAGGGSLFLISWVYEKLRHQEGIGGGDVKLAAMLGAFFGWKGVFVILLLSSLLGSITGILLMIVLRKGLKLAIPYGPFLAGGALVHLFVGPELIQWYLGLTPYLYKI